MKLKILRLALGVMTAALHSATAEAGTVTPYAGVGVQSAAYSVTVDGQNVPVNAWNHTTGTAHYAHFAFTGTVTVQVTSIAGNFGAASVSPKRLSISPAVSGNQLSFPLNAPAKLVIYTGGTRIFIFAEGPETTPSQPTLQPGTIQSPPSLPSGQAPDSATGSLSFLSNP